MTATWQLAADRKTRTSYGRPTYTYDPPTPVIDGNYGAIFDVWGIATGVAVPATYGSIVDVWGVSTSTVTPPVDMTRPTGTGIYAIEDLTGIGDYTTAGGFIAGCNKVNTLTAMANGRRTITLPAGVWSCDGFGQSVQNIGFLVPDGVDIVGSGPDRTIFQVAPDSITQYQFDTWFTPATYQSPIQLHLMHWQKGVSGCKLAQVGFRGTRQRVNGAGADASYSGLIVYKATDPQIIDVKVQGVPGFLNSPPGETSGIGFNNGTGGLAQRLEVDGRDFVTGVKKGAAGMSTNTHPGLTIRDSYVHHMGFSHGFAMWQSPNTTFYNCTSENNGTTDAGGQLGGTSGDGFNFEKSSNSRMFNCRTGFNTLCEVRYYGRADGDAWSNDTFPHSQADTVVTDGGPFNIRIDNAQVTLPTLTRCPTPVYAYS